MTSMRKWTADGSDRTNYLRLGTYLPDEDALKPSQYAGTFSQSDGVLMATTGDWYLQTDKAIDIEIQGDATVHIGNFSTDTDKYLKIDVLEGNATTSTYTDSNGYSHSSTSYSGESGTLKGSGVALNAVTDASTAAAATAGKLMLNAADKIIINSDGMSKFTAGVNVSVKNKSESTYGSNTLQFNLGFVNSIVFGMQAKIVAGLYMSAMVGIRIQIRPLDCKISGNDFSYCLGKNEFIGYKSENQGMVAFLLGCTAFVGVAAQKKSLAKSKQKVLGNKTKGSSLALRMAGVKSSTVSSNMGVSNVA